LKIKRVLAKEPIFLIKSSNKKVKKYFTLLKMKITALRYFAARAERELEGETSFVEPKAQQKTFLTQNFLVFAAQR